MLFTDVNVLQFGRLSPLPPGADTLCKDMAAVYEDVFNEKAPAKLPKTFPSSNKESSTPEPAANEHSYMPEPTANSFTSSNIYLPNPDIAALHVSPPETPTSDNEMLRMLDFETPKSFENSPNIRIDELHMLDTAFPNNDLTVPTPMPSPVNKHPRNCRNSFCVIHDSITDSPGPASVFSSLGNSDSEDDDSSNNETPKSTKRKRNENEWSDVKRKCLKNLGKQYVSKKGEYVDEKIMKGRCNCRYKCSTKISEDQRLNCFQRFWELGTKEKQWGYVVKYTQKENKKRTLNTSVNNKRKFTYKYFLPTTLCSEVGQNEKIDVCKTMFLNTLSISDRVVKTAWDKYDGSTIIATDNRGRHQNHKKVITDDMVKSVCDHVNSFVPVEAHYVRKNSTKVYLEGFLSIARMYQLYDEEWYDSSKYTCKAGNERQYRDIVNGHFNLGFHQPKKDQCDVCHIFRNVRVPTEEQMSQQKAHIEEKNIARRMKKQDKRAGRKSNGSIVAAVFDFEKVLSCPYGDVSTFYYKRKLSCLNFTVYDLGKKKGICYMWDETEGKRGANDVSSCLLNYIDKHVKEGATEFRFWSDNCTGQNRNRIVFSLYLYAAKKYNITITHRFLVKGHTQNEGDSVHATIERGAIGKTIYTPDQWRLHVSWVKVDGNPYTVKKMTHRDFLDFKCHVTDKVWNKNTKNKKVTWTSLKEVSVQSNDPNKLLYKTDLIGDSESVKIYASTRNNALIHLERAYSSQMKLAEDKYKDLKSLCDSGIISDEFKDFFMLLPH